MNRTVRNIGFIVAAGIAGVSLVVLISTNIYIWDNSEAFKANTVRIKIIHDIVQSQLDMVNSPTYQGDQLFLYRQALLDSSFILLGRSGDLLSTNLGLLGQRLEYLRTNTVAMLTLGASTVILFVLLRKEDNEQAK